MTATHTLPRGPTGATGGVHAAGRGRALRTVVAIYGAIVAVAGFEHGVGEVLQGRSRPTGSSSSPGRMRRAADRVTATATSLGTGG